MGFLRLFGLLIRASWQFLWIVAGLIGLLTEWPDFEKQYGVRPYLDAIYTRALGILENYPLGVFLGICFIGFLAYFIGVKPKARSKVEFEQRRKPRAGKRRRNSGSKRRKRRK